jgi:hypothetical protein
MDPLPVNARHRFPAVVDGMPMLALVTLEALNPWTTALSVLDPVTEMDPPHSAPAVGEQETTTLNADPVGGLASLKTLTNPFVPVSAEPFADCPGDSAVMVMPL